MTALNITITDAGRAEMISGSHTSLNPLEITEIALGTGTAATDPTDTALQSETKRVSTIAGLVVADDIIHVTVKDESTDAYDVTEFGLFSGSGTLFAVYSQPSHIMQKAASSTLLLSVDIAIATLDAASLNFGDVTFTNPPATETVKGVAEIATQAEVDAGTDHSRMVTPKTLSAAGFPSGTKVLFVQAAAPTGWTKVTDHNNKALRIVSGGSGGGSGGSIDFTAALKSQSVSGSVANTTATGSVTVNNHTLSTSQVPSHRHGFKESTSSSGDGPGIGDSGPNTGGPTLYTDYQGGGGAHNHGASFSGTAHGHTFNGTDINMAVKYVDTIIATKD